MKKKFYAVGETFKDEESGKILKVIEFNYKEPDCQLCFYSNKDCGIIAPDCQRGARIDAKSVHFENVETND